MKQLLSLAICFLLASISSFAQDAKYPIEISDHNGEYIGVRMPQYHSPFMKRGWNGIGYSDFNEEKLKTIISELKVKYLTSIQREKIKEFSPEAFSACALYDKRGKIYYVTFRVERDVFNLLTKRQWQRLYDAFWNFTFPVQNYKEPETVIKPRNPAHNESIAGTIFSFISPDRENSSNWN